MKRNSILYKTLCRALSLKRPHNGEGASLFTGWLCDNVPPHLELTIDAAGNVHIDNRTSTKHRTLFIAHVDTVHREDGPNKFVKAHGKWYANGAPLGADDGAGCAMLMHLLHAGVAGYYIFSQGEECGGIGAKHISTHDQDLLKQFDRAIAFDRRGIDSVITYQGYGRCCSDAFAGALSDALNVDERLMYLPDDTGVYTDTAEFTDIIPECTNISVGYASEHSANESLDIFHFSALAERVVNIDWDSLPTDRDPSVYETKNWGKWGGEWATTSVNSSSVYGTYPAFDDTYYLDEEREEVREAIYEAMGGWPDWLAVLIAESVYPEDPDMAEHFIDKRKLAGYILLSEHLKKLNTYDAGVVLASLFDSVYREHA
jgi:hypothetical protein